MRLMTTVVLAVVLWVPAALPQTPTSSGYGGAGAVVGTAPAVPSQPAVAETVADDGGDVLGEESSGAVAPADDARAVAGSTLPFTGFDLLLIAAGGMLLVTVGVALRRMARRDDDVVPL